MDTKIKKQILSLNKLQEYIPIENLEGELLLEGRFGGKIDELSYQLNILSNKLGVKGIFFNNLKVY